jgi:hypothetical protein
VAEQSQIADDEIIRPVSSQCPDAALVLKLQPREDFGSVEWHDEIAFDEMPRRAAQFSAGVGVFRALQSVVRAREHATRIFALQLELQAFGLNAILVVEDIKIRAGLDCL